MKYVIQQVYREAGAGEQDNSWVCDDTGEWYAKIEEAKEPFTTIESAREAAAYLRYENDHVYGDGDEECVEFQIVNVQTRTRYSEKDGK
jgi:hypothetical protein